jgi:hypothetical protein
MLSAVLPQTVLSWSVFKCRLLNLYYDTAEKCFRFKIFQEIPLQARL